MLGGGRALSGTPISAIALGATYGDTTHMYHQEDKGLANQP